MPSTIYTEPQQHLLQNGFTENQIRQMEDHEVQPDDIKAVLDANLTPADRRKVVHVIVSLLESLPLAAKFEITLQADDLPSITTYVRNLPEEDKDLVGGIYSSLSDNEYIFDMGKGYVRLRSLQAEPLG